MPHKPIFIVVEGIDGSGKTTVSRLVYNKLSRLCRVKLTSEPFDRTILKLAEVSQKKFADSPILAIDCSALLFTYDRARHTLNIRRWLSEGRSVICDRYFMSTIAYQGAQYRMAGSDRSSWLRSINRPFIDAPDMLIYMESDPSVAIKRIKERGADSPLFENELFLRETAAAYAREYRAFRGIKRRIKADRPVAEVCEEALDAIKKAMELI